MELTAEALYMNYGTTVALNYVDFTLTEGIYGLLGANGAGKSTLIRLLTGNLKPTSGEIWVNGKNLDQVMNAYLRRLGYVPQKQGMYPGMSAQQFMAYMAELKEIPSKKAKPQIEELLKRVHLYENKDRKLSDFSGGMKQRVLIAQALLGNPEIVILDEPTAGLDPKERIRIRNSISELSFHKIILIATHVVTDIEFISKEILILDQGSMIRRGKPDELLCELDHRVFQIWMKLEEYETFSQKSRISNVMRLGDRVRVRILADQQEISAFPGQNAQEVQPDLEDLYLYLFAKRTEGEWQNA